MDESDLYAARYCPGFSPVLTSWQVFIARNRWLRQKVVVYDTESQYHNQVLWFRAKLSRPEMAGIAEIVERIGFRGFDQHYQHETMRVTDCPLYFLSVRTFRDLHGDLGTLPREVEEDAKRLYIYGKAGAGEPVWSLLEAFVEKNRPELFAEIMRVAGE